MLITSVYTPSLSPLCFLTWLCSTIIYLLCFRTQIKFGTIIKNIMQKKKVYIQVNPIIHSYQCLHRSYNIYSISYFSNPSNITSLYKTFNISIIIPHSCVIDTYFLLNNVYLVVQSKVSNFLLLYLFYTGYYLLKNSSYEKIK